MIQNGNISADIERRRHDRLHKKFTLRYCLAEEDLHIDCRTEAEILDIGGGGIRFLAPCNLPKNTQILFNLPLADWGKDKIEWQAIFTTAKNRNLTVLGRVMWSSAGKELNDTYETGVCFIGRIESSSTREG